MATTMTTQATPATLAAPEPTKADGYTLTWERDEFGTLNTICHISTRAYVAIFATEKTIGADNEYEVEVQYYNEDCEGGGFDGRYFYLDEWSQVENLAMLMVDTIMATR